MNTKERLTNIQDKNIEDSDYEQNRVGQSATIKYKQCIKLLNTQLAQTRIQSQISNEAQKQKNSLISFIQKKVFDQRNKKIEDMKRSIRNKSYLMEKVNHYIYEIADRNQAVDANYAHFLMLLYLTIEEIVLNIYPSQHLISTQKFIFCKLQTKNIKKQLQQSLYYEFVTFVLRKQKINPKLVHSWMRKIMTDQRQLCTAIFPYYFNLFAFVVNKQVIFNAQPEQNLIPYTIQIQTVNRYRGSFTKQEVFKQMRRIEKATIDHYHSPQL